MIKNKKKLTFNSLSNFSNRFNLKQKKISDDVSAFFNQTENYKFQKSNNILLQSIINKKNPGASVSTPGFLFGLESIDIDSNPIFLVVIRDIKSIATVITSDNFELLNVGIIAVIHIFIHPTQELKNLGKLIGLRHFFHILSHKMTLTFLFISIIYYTKKKHNNREICAYNIRI